MSRIPRAPGCGGGIMSGVVEDCVDAGHPQRSPRPARTHSSVAEENLVLPVIYSMSVSLDGFIAGPGGDIGWTAPDAEQFRFHIEQTRHIAVHLCGRALYQEMLVWETAEQTMSGEAELEFARIW